MRIAKASRAFLEVFVWRKADAEEDFEDAEADFDAGFEVAGDFGGAADALAVVHGMRLLLRMSAPP